MLYNETGLPDFIFIEFDYIIRLTHFYFWLSNLVYCYLKLVISVFYYIVLVELNQFKNLLVVYFYSFFIRFFHLPEITQNLNYLFLIYTYISTSIFIITVLPMFYHLILSFEISHYIICFILIHFFYIALTLFLAIIIDSLII